MRASVVLALLLAGCTVPADPLDGVDPTVPLYGQAGVQLHGDHHESFPDALVLAADCRAGRTLAYTFNVTSVLRSATSAFLESRLELPNVTSYAFAAYAPTLEGLAPSVLLQGGTAMASIVDAFGTARWSPDLPDAFQVPLDNGIGRVILGCQGDGPVNYVISDDPRIDAPHYVEPVEVDGFDSFAVLGEGDIGTIYLPPTAAPVFPVSWTAAGGAQYQFTESSPVTGLRMGLSQVRWNGGPGWTYATCATFGLHDVGEWSYEADLHGVPRAVGGVMADTITTLGLSQAVLSGYMDIHHIEEGLEDGEFAFTMEHAASLGVSWEVSCHGVHFGTTMTQAFGAPARLEWDPPRGFLQ